MTDVPDVSGGTGIIAGVREMIEKPINELKARVDTLRTIVDESYLELAGLLHNIAVERKFEPMGHKNMKDYVEKELDFSYRKAQYLVRIWQRFAVEIKDPTVLEKVAGLGWGKLKELTTVVTARNVDEWIEKAARLSAAELKVVVDESKRVPSSPTAERPVAEVTEATFEEPETLRGINFKLYDQQFENVEQALKLAGEVGDTNIQSQQLSLIALSYLASEEKTAMTKKERITRTFKALADQFGVDIIVIQGETILLGEELLTS